MKNSEKRKMVLCLSFVMLSLALTACSNDDEASTAMADVTSAQTSSSYAAEESSESGESYVYESASKAVTSSITTYESKASETSVSEVSGKKENAVTSKPYAVTAAKETAPTVIKEVQQTQPAVKQTTQQAIETTVAKTETPATAKAELYISSDGTPPLNDELKEFYRQTLKVFYEFTAGFPNADYNTEYISINGQDGFYKVSDSRFNTVQGVSDYLHKYFTDDYISKYNFLSKFAEYNGDLYVQNYAKSTSMSYAGHTFEIVSQSDSEIQLKATVYYDSCEPPMYPTFYETPSDTSRYTTLEKQYTLVKVNGEWRFSEFQVLY